MITGIGVDIVAIDRLRRGEARFGRRLAQRILSPREFEDYAIAGDGAAYLARRFAAKEAFSKALGTGFRNGLALRQITVVHGEHGRPGLSLEGRAAELLGERGGGRVHLSLSDERDHAVAFVVIEG
ncbi:MAG: holo-ACP synthase [Gammaproteobacteria bacterium]|nr:MAG: holo-ACP synthase [Gammaproteobacteria bacterium]